MALRGEDFLKLPGEEARKMSRENRVVYIYHNRIDAAGDKKDSESQAFEAVKRTQDELMTIIKKLTAANANNLIITADHGFIYQHRPIEDSDFSGAEVNGEAIIQQDRHDLNFDLKSNNPREREMTALKPWLTLLRRSNILTISDRNRLSRMNRKMEMQRRITPNNLHPKKRGLF